MSKPLKALVDIISSQTALLQAAYATHGAEVPSIDATFQPGPLEFDPNLARARQLIVAAAAQLIATVQLPTEFLQDAAPAMFKSASIGFVIDVDIPELLAEAGPQGLHVRAISASTRVDSSYIARVLRYLATRHIFREVTPNVFTHNRNSTLLTKNKTVEELRSDTLGRFDKAPFTSFLHVATDELLASSAHFSTYLQNSDQVTAAFNIAFKTPKKMWDWWEEPENDWRLRRFTTAMKANSDMFPPQIFISGIDGDALKPDDLVVDVGGSVGTVTLTLKKAFPKLQYVVQDLEKQITAGKEYWEENDPEALRSGRVALQVHDFFDPQPVKNAAVYFLHVVIHDWPDSEARKILSNLRAAAGPDSKLVIFDHLARYTCEDPCSEDLSLSKTPFPLLANLGIAGEGFSTALDLNMLALYDGKERTRDEFAQLGEESGWRLECVEPGVLATYTFSPI